MISDRTSCLRLTLLTLVLALVAAGLFRLTTVRTDAEVFFPRADKGASRLIAEQLQAGPAASTMLVAISGDTPQTLAALSREFADRVGRDRRFSFVTNGRLRRDDQTLAWVIRNRYLLDPAVDRKSFTPKALAAAGERLKAAMATSIGLAAPDLLFSDLTGRTEIVLRHLAGEDAPHARDGVWFSRDEKRALLILRTSARGLDLDAQAAAMAVMDGAFAAARKKVGSAGARLTVSGPAVFALQSRETIRSDAVWLSGIASVFVLLVVIAALRSATMIWAFTLTVAGGLIAGSAAVVLVFGDIHGITLTFGAMLVGLAVDYPLHVALHRQGDGSLAGAARSVWPTLRLSAASTIVAFLPLFFSSFPGLAQLGLIAIVGLATAVLMARYVLPWTVAPRRAIDIGLSLAPLRRNRWPVAVLVLCLLLLAIGGAGRYLAMGGAVWEDNLARLSPVSSAQIALDRQLRSDLTTADPRYMILVQGQTREAALSGAEAVGARLDRAVAAGRLKGYDTPTRFLPSSTLQKRRQAALPGGPELRASLLAAGLDRDFRPDAFDGFVADVARAKSPGGLVTAASLRQTAFDQRLSTILFERDGHWFAMLLLKGLTVPAEEIARQAVSPVRAARLVDLAAEAGRLVAGYRQETLVWLALGALLSLGLLTAALRRSRAVAQVFLPVLISLVVVVAALLALGIPISLFHILALMIVAGLGFDYAVFLGRFAGTGDGERRAFQSVTICAISTAGVYSILAFSSLPVLQGIGLATAIGVVAAFGATTLLAAFRSSARLGTEA